MTNDDLINALKESNGSETERLNALKTNIEAAEAREVLAEYADDAEPEEFEDIDDEVVIRLARTMAENVSRENARQNEFAAAVNANVSPTSRAEWEQQQADK